MFEEFEKYIIQVQQYPAVFVIECFLSLYLLTSQGIMAEKFLLPSMLKICEDYKISKPVGGVLIAVGMSMPELTATMLSFQEHGVKMTEFGLALVIGGLGFAISMIPAVAYLLNFGCRVARPAQPTDHQSLYNNQRFKNCFIRDMSFMMASLFLYFIELQEGTLSLTSVLTQLLLFVVYSVAVYSMDKQSTEKEQQQIDPKQQKKDASQDGSGS